ncbi:MAG: hypothetical protein OHK0021_17010 [Bryobacter sp.]
MGTIKDATGASITNAKITLRSSDTGVEATANTSEDGNYLFGGVKIGRYTLSAEAQGFKKAVAEEFTVTVNARQRVNLVLQVGEVTESVTVSEAAAVLESETSSRGTVVSAKQILNLPLNGRNYADLALLAPGVRRSLIAGSRDASFNINGMRSSQNNFVIDGVDNNAYGTSNQGFSNQVVQISPDAVQEFRIETNNFSAEFGRAGGGVINATIRSGGNEFHGAGWWFGRNTSLNAFGFFKNDLNRDGRVDDQDKPVLEQNQFGGAIGGPIVKNKMFFFADYEGFRRDSSTPRFTNVPQGAFQSGDFTALATPIRNPITGDLIPGNRVPASQITPFARDLLAALPEPNVPGQAVQLFAQPLRTDQNDKGDIRYDHYFSDKFNAFARYSHRLLNNLEPPSIPGEAGGDSNGRVRVLNQQMAFGTNWTINPTSLLEFRMGVSLTEGGKVTIFQGQPNVYGTYNIPNGPTDENVVGGFYRQVVNGYTAFGVQSSNPQFQNPFVINPKVNYSKIWGKHTMKAGYEYQRISTAIDDFNPKYGQDSYSGQFSRPAGAAANNAYNLIDFMYGARSNYQLNNTVIVDYRQAMNFFYFQDDWKVNRFLTLNLGVRYEYGTPQWEANGRLSNFDPTTNSLIQATADGSVEERALIRPDRNNWAPRIGMALQANSKTVIRAAYGISYIHFNRMGGENILAFNLPNIIGVNIQQLSPVSGGRPLCTGLNQAPQDCFRTREQGYPNNLLNIANVNQINVRANYIPRDLRSGYIHSFHTSIQRQLGAGFVLDAGYVGTRGRKLMILGDFNQARPNGATESLSVQARRPIQNFGQIQIATDLGFLDYDALQMKIEKRFGSLFVLNSLTWGRGIDNASGHLETANGDNSRLNFRNLEIERGYTGYDQRWNNTSTVVYELPFGKGRKYMSNANWLAQGVLGGWRINVINTANAGLPYNITYSPTAPFQVAAGGAPNYRPNIVGDAVLPYNLRTAGNRLQFLNPCLSQADTRFSYCANIGAGVVEPTDRRQPFGNAFRNGVRGPMFLQTDFGLHKEFPITERSNFQFRFEAFNLFNRTNFAGVDVNRTSGNFGRITSAFPARELQFAVKYIF